MKELNGQLKNCSLLSYLSEGIQIQHYVHLCLELRRYLVMCYVHTCTLITDHACVSILFRIHDNVRRDYFATSNDHQTEDSQWNESAEGLEKETSSSSLSHESSTDIPELTPIRSLSKGQLRLSIGHKDPLPQLETPVTPVQDETVNVGIDCQLPLQRTKEGLL